MSRVLLLCFIHGFKGNNNTFQDFPYDLKVNVAKQLPAHHVESLVYPQYETSGELPKATEAFLEWLKERVMDTRKAHFQDPWPPNDRRVGVILVAHSMGGFVAADSVFLALNEASSNPTAQGHMFPLIQGILAFDTPYNGLARSMFVYGAFSNYQKVNGVFNAMTALSAAAPAALSSMTRRTGNPFPASVPSSSSGSSSKWTAWQLLAVRTGTVGAIAAGGVAAYTHRDAIRQGLQSIRGMNRESLAEGYRQGLDTIGQGLAYINRGNVGKSFAWLSDHFTFVGALLKQKELSRRLDRLEALKGVGIEDFYASLGENGYWSGGYFVPERTFCAVPEADHPAHRLFSRVVLTDQEDEIQAHISLFRPKRHKKYDQMVDKSAQLAKQWFLSEEQAVDDPRFAERSPEDAAEEAFIEKAVGAADGGEGSLEEVEEKVGGQTAPADASADKDKLPDESPIDIAAAASLVPLPGDEGNLSADESAEAEAKRTYIQHLFQVAQSAGTEVKGWWPTKAPQMPTMSNLPTMPAIPSSVSSLANVSIPGAGMFSKKKAVPAQEGVQEEASKTDEAAKDEASKDEAPKEEAAAATTEETSGKEEKATKAE
ncbi:hypothetical protein S40293_00095 [Stachybotrys chartarum IBT 40293]|nr:hypothetical protein S40293_00095 [Stachybotrys chartarum IBT 40293]KFA71415.1 hypothetical protein S40288_04284 [Stachybotrys chartarum IBT 40288]